MARNLPYASTFTDLSAAETATGDNIAANESVIAKWLSGTSARLAIQNGVDSAGGTIYDATQSFISPSAVNTVLVRIASGYNILTSYPIP
jgi:Bacterial CdiA-CT RNAse A domain